MVNKLLFLFICIFYVYNCYSDTTKNLNLWKGEYIYTEDAGITAGGSHVLISYSIYIGTKYTQSKETCSIEIIGFQTYDLITCKVSYLKGKLYIRFKSSSTSSIYNENDFLLAIEKQNNQYVTEWGKLIRNNNENNTIFTKFK